MKKRYVRTAEMIADLNDYFVEKKLTDHPYVHKETAFCLYKDRILNKSNDLEYLADELIIKYKKENKYKLMNINDLLKVCESTGNNFKKYIYWLFQKYKNDLENCYLAIWTKFGLKFVAQLNSNNEFELL